jgi:hypothetical protein
MVTMRRVLGQPRRGRMFSVLVLGVAVIGVVVTAAVALRVALPQEPRSVPAITEGPSPSPWPVPAGV